MRSAYERGADLEIVAINDVADPATLAHLFAYDSVYGRFAPEVTCDGVVMAFDGREIPVLSEHDPGDLPWADLDVDVVIEASGRFRTGAPQVLVRAVEQALVGGVGVDGRHLPVADTDRLVEDLGHRCQAVGRARGDRDDVVGCGVVDLVEVDAQHDVGVDRLGSLARRRQAKPRSTVSAAGVCPVWEVK